MSRRSKAGLGAIAVLCATSAAFAADGADRPRPPRDAIRIPSRIDRTGSTDVGPELASFIAKVPDGSTIVFPPGTYLCPERCIEISGRKGLTFWGYGATIRNTARGTSHRHSAFHLVRRNRNIKVLGFTLRGSNRDAASERAYHPGAEHSQGVSMYDGNSDIMLADLRIRGQWGHCLYISSGTGIAINRRVTLRDSLCERSGVMGLVVASGRDIRFLRNVIRDIALYPIDVEDGKRGQPVDGVLIRNNTIRRWGWNPYYTCHAIVGASSVGLSPFRDVRIINNRLIEGDMASPSGGCHGLAGVIAFDGSDHKTDFVIQGNRILLPRSQRSALGVRLNNLTGGVIKSNDMPGLSVQCTRCSGVRH